MKFFVTFALLGTVAAATATATATADSARCVEIS